MRHQTIEWHYCAAAEGWDEHNPDVALWLDIAKVDAAWQRTGQYIGPGGTNGQGRRYAKAGEWFAKCPFSNMLIVNLQPEGAVTFTDGRHRFSWLRDHGAMAIQLQVSPADAEKLTALYGTDLTETMLEIPD